MPELHAVTPERHAGKRWNRLENYLVAKNDSCCPLVFAELPSAMRYLTIAFATIDGQHQPVAVQGFEENNNLLITDEGLWLARYVPALYRGLPFFLVKKEADQILCINEDINGLIDADSQTAGELFFGEDGEPSDSLQSMLDFHSQITASRDKTIQIVDLLQNMKLIVPWELTVQKGDSKFLVEGLGKVDETALNDLPATALEELRDAGALAVAYMQILSMQNVSDLINIARAKSQHKSTNEVFLDQSDTDVLSFDNF